MDSEAKKNIAINNLTQEILKGKLADANLEFLQRHLSRLQDCVDEFIYTKLQSGTPTNDDLLRAYTEKFAYERILQALRKSARSGKGAGEQLQKLSEQKDVKKRTGTTYSTYSGLGTGGNGKA